MNITIIGSGVSGLTTGIRLLEAGHSATILARDLPPHTTSNIAAATWYPYRAFPIERVSAWGQRSLEVFYELARTPGTGVSLAEALEVFRHDAEDPWWRGCVVHFRRARPDELLPGCISGYVFETVVAETGIYMDYLLRRFREAGGQVVQRVVPSLAEALRETSVVVNCAGLGARTLVGDDTLYPIRGQLVRVAPPPVDRIILDEDDPLGVTYIVPRSTDCILGGTADVGNWSLEPDVAAAEAIIERCSRLAPEVRNSRVVEHLVGLRPGRPAVRLEAEPQPGGGLVVHNYGHGGAGVTLSWGCAEEVVSLLTS